MEFRLLGPMEVRAGAAPLELGGRKQQALLARLLLTPGRTVAVEQLVDDMWGDEVPETAVKMIQIYVSQLRKLLPDGLLVTRAPGYLADVEPEAIDVARFARLRAEARAALTAGDAARAAARARTALALWQGPALAGFTEPFAVVEAAHLEELHLACHEDRIEADLALGAHGELTGELERLVSRAPLRERLRGQLMRALYGAGRQAEALEAYREFRTTLDQELGIEPSTALRDLERQILQHDERLDRRPSRAPVRAGRDDRETQFVQNGDVSIAYQVVGGGPLDIVLVHGWVCSFAPGWEWPALARFYERLASMGRLILFDKRGTGLSDRVHGVATLEERMDDVRAVMDAAGSERAAVLGISEGGPMVSLFAATYPERTAALVAMGTFARRAAGSDYPIAVPWLDVSPERWGLPVAREFLAERAPTIADDEDAVRWYASYLVRGASPGAAEALRRMNAQIDVRPVLSTIAVPTLVLYREDEYLREATRYMGERIPGARVVGLPGPDHLPWEGVQDDVLAEVERVPGRRPRRGGRGHDPRHRADDPARGRRRGAARGAHAAPAAAVPRRADRCHARAVRRPGARDPLRARRRRRGGGPRARAERRSAHRRVRGGRRPDRRRRRRGQRAGRGSGRRRRGARVPDRARPRRRLGAGVRAPGRAVLGDARRRGAERDRVRRGRQQKQRAEHHAQRAVTARRQRRAARRDGDQVAELSRRGAESGGADPVGGPASVRPPAANTSGANSPALAHRAGRTRPNTATPPASTAPSPASSRPEWRSTQRRARNAPGKYAAAATPSSTRSTPWRRRSSRAAARPRTPGFPTSRRRRTARPTPSRGARGRMTAARRPPAPPACVPGSVLSAASAITDAASGSARNAARQLASATAPTTGIPTTQDAGWPTIAHASARLRCPGGAHGRQQWPEHEERGLGREQAEEEHRAESSHAATSRPGAQAAVAGGTARLPAACRPLTARGGGRERLPAAGAAGGRAQRLDRRERADGRHSLAGRAARSSHAGASASGRSATPAGSGSAAGAGTSA